MKKSVSKWIALLLSVVMIVMCAAGCSKTQTQETATDDTTDAPAQTADTPAQADEPEQADAPAQDEPVTITFWHTYGDSEEAQFLNVVMPLWESLHPEIKVEAVRQPVPPDDCDLLRHRHEPGRGPCGHCQYCSLCQAGRSDRAE